MYSGVSRLVKLPRHLVGPVTQEFETPIPSQPNEKKSYYFYNSYHAQKISGLC